MNKETDNIIGAWNHTIQKSHAADKDKERRKIIIT